MKLYHIRPFDTVVFGENRGSVLGDDHEKGGKFPPEIMKLFNLGDVKFLGIFPLREREIFLPMPADVLTRRKSKGGPYYIPWLNSLSGLSFKTDLNRNLLPWTGVHDALERAGGYIPASSFFEEYIKVRSGRLHIDASKYTDGDLFKEEVRIGIAIDYSTGTVKESMLYTHVHYRLEYGFVVLVHKDGMGRPSIAPVGGERKVSRIGDFEDEKFTKEAMKKENIREGEIYKFYLTTHAFVDSELEPGSEITIADAVNNEGDRIDMKVIWMYSAGAEWISGIETRPGEDGMRRKPALYMLRPGTVFLLEAKGNGNLNRFSQIIAPINLNENDNGIDESRFIERGWGSGIIWKVEDFESKKEV